MPLKFSGDAVEQALREIPPFQVSLQKNEKSGFMPF